MTTEIAIRRANPTDWPVIAGFNSQLAWETEQKTLQPYVISAGVQRLLADSQRGLYFLAEIAGEPVGQMMFTKEWSDWRNGEIWWLQSVYVRVEHRRSGVFRALLNHLRAAAEADSMVVGLRLYMEEHNEQAQSTYLRAGFRQSGYVVMEHIFRNQPTGNQSGELPT